MERLKVSLEFCKYLKNEANKENEDEKSRKYMEQINESITNITKEMEKYSRCNKLAGVSKRRLKEDKKCAKVSCWKIPNESIGIVKLNSGSKCYGSGICTGIVGIKSCNQIMSTKCKHKLCKTCCERINNKACSAHKCNKKVKKRYKISYECINKKLKV